MPSSKVMMLPSSEMVPTAVTMRTYESKRAHDDISRAVASTMRWSMPPLGDLMSRCLSSFQTLSGRRESRVCVSNDSATLSGLCVTRSMSAPEPETCVSLAWSTT